MTLPFAPKTEITWFQKDEFQAVIDHFFARNSNWPQAQKAYSSFQPPTSSLRAGEGRE